MQGYCGWISFEATGAPATDVVARMAPGQSNRMAHGNEFGAFKVCASDSYELSTFVGDDGFAIVEGNPEVRDENFSALADEQGLARACYVLFAESGSDFLEQLAGPFCLIVSLGKQSRALMATDRVGVRPVYYAICRSGMAFGSRLENIRGCSEVDFEIDPQSIYDYLYYHVIPSPNTIFKQAKSLEPGWVLEITNGNPLLSQYWQVTYTEDQARPDFDVLKSEFKEVLRQCVQMESNLSPDVGCFLSGGTDSSTLAGMLGEVIDGPASTYSIGFDQKGFDEMGYARIAARHFRTDHHEYYVTPEDILNLVPKIAQIYGQPFGNSSVIPTYYCAKMAASDGKQRLLGGDGGDELFGGNERYATQTLFSYYDRIPRRIRRQVVEPIVNGFPFGERIMPVRKVRRHIEQARVPMPERLETYGYLHFLGREVMLDPGFLATVDPDKSIDSLKQAYANTHAQHLINRMLDLDLKLTLGDNDIPKVSRMSEFAGVTAGYPFLREPMIEFAARLPADYKVRNLKIRWFFKKALRDYLPKEIINKQKHGFGLPFGDWLVSHKGLRSLAYDSIEGLKKRRILRADFLDNLRDHKVSEHPNYFGGLVWVLMMLEQWLEHDSSSR